MGDLKEPHAFLEERIDEAGMMVPIIALNSEQKIEVLVALLIRFNEGIDSWHNRAFTAVTWGVGLKYAAVSSIFAYRDQMDFLALRDCFRT